VPYVAPQPSTSTLNLNLNPAPSFFSRYYSRYFFKLFCQVVLTSSGGRIKRPHRVYSVSRLRFSLSHGRQRQRPTGISNRLQYKKYKAQSLSDPIHFSLYKSIYSNSSYTLCINNIKQTDCFRRKQKNIERTQKKKRSTHTVTGIKFLIKLNVFPYTILSVQ
jgi:hypothetical protein